MYNVTDPVALPWYDNVIHDFPDATYQCKSLTQVPVTMRDGVDLNTRIFKPTHIEPYDVLLTRNPYPANESLCEALYLPLVEQGYCVIIQDCRGTGGSQGQWQPFENERADSIDTLNWLQEQNWVKTISTFGRSYSAFTQWIAGDSLPSKVKTMILEVYGVNRFDQVYANGMFREDIYTSWAFANSGISSDISTGDQFKLAIKHTPANTRDQSILGQTLPFYQDYLRENQITSDYWKKSMWQTLLDIPAKINVPVLVTDGWADHHLQGSLIGFRALRPEIKKKSRLIITPTDHIGNLTGDLNYPDANRFGFMNMRANLDWLNYVLGDTRNIFDSACYLMRSGQWLNPAISAEKPTRYILESAGQLTLTSTQASAQHFRYDPTKPNTWPGGNELLAWITPGFTDQPHGFTVTPPYPQRPDTIRFISTPFKDTTTLLGNVTLHLKVASSCADTAFAVRLCEQTKGNQYINIKDGIGSLAHAARATGYTAGIAITLTLDLGDVAWQIHAGSSIVLLISSSNFPMYAIHSNKPQLWSQQTLDQIIADQTVFTGLNGSTIDLPFIQN